MFSKAKLLLYSILLLAAGFITNREEVRLAIIRFINHVFSMKLDEEFRSFGLYYFSTFLVLGGCILLLFYFFKSGSISSRQFFFLATGLLFMHYFYHVWINAVNYPIFDDQSQVMSFLYDYIHRGTIRQKAELIFEPYNESWIVVPHLVSLLAWKIFHELNYRQLICFNAFLLFFLFLLLAKSYLKEGKEKHLFLLALFVFQLQYFDNIFQVLSGLAYYGVILFSVLSLHFLFKRNSPWRYLALPFAFFALLTFANGVITFLISAVYIVIKREKKELILLTIFLSIISLLYYRSITSNTLVNHEFYFNAFIWFRFITEILGSAFQFFYVPYVPAIMGVFITGVFVIAMYKKWYRNSPVRFLILAVLIFSIVLAATLRSGFFESTDFALPVRYGFFSIMAFTLALGLLIDNFKKVNIKILLIAAISYNILTGVFFYPETAIRTRILKDFKSQAANGKYNLRYSLSHEQQEVETLFKGSMDSGIYKP